jgi:SAM-dependent methyltransferase
MTRARIFSDDTFFEKDLGGQDTPMRSQSDAAKFFDSFAEAFDSLYDRKRNFFMRWLDRTFRSDMFMRFALSFESFGDLTGKTVLDIGCGSGPYVVEALNRGAEWVTAVDPAPNMLALVGKRLDVSRYLARNLMRSAPFVFYCHPYELDPLEFKEIPIKIPLHVRLHQGLGRRWCMQRFKAFLERFGGQPIENLLSSGMWPKFTLHSTSATG